MWIWTCSACSERFTGWTKQAAEEAFFTHARAEHNPTTILSTTMEGSPDA